MVLSSDPASSTASATPASFIGVPASTWTPKLSISSATSASGTWPPTGSRTLSTGALCKDASM